MRLLADRPASGDQFGPHGRVARGIQNLIDSSDGGKTIAVRGGWGAGKSTVIKLLSKHYATSDVFVFVYDAWVHVGDPLRRAFLSSLVSALIGRGWLKSGKRWSDSQEKLAGRLKESTRRSIPDLTPFSKFLAAALLLVPTGTSVLSEGVKSWATSGSHVLPLVVTGGVLSLLPMVGIIVSLIAAAREGKSANEMFAFFVNREITSEATTTTETGVATSIEFQEFFASVVNDVLDDRNPKRKLVIVVDNLDRLEQEAAKEVWALLRSFLDMPDHNEAAWTNRLWVIVPIASESGEPSKAEKVAPSEGFLTKIFQARFDLPPPVLKGWRPYLGLTLTQAFPSISHAEKRQILDLYLACMVPGQALTPRELVSFVNNLVALASQWGDGMPVPVLAAYLLDAKHRLGEAGTPGEALQQKTIPSEASERVLERSIRDEFAMIYFNTGAQEALELLQKPEAERILASGNGELLHEEIFKESSFGTIAGIVLGEMKPLIKADTSRIFLPLAAVYDAMSLPADQANTPAIEELTATYRTAERLSLEVLSSMPAAPYGTESFVTLADAILKVGKRTSVEAMIALMSRRSSNNAEGMFNAPKAETIHTWTDWQSGCKRLANHSLIKAAIESGECIPFTDLPIQTYLVLLKEFRGTSTFNALARSSAMQLMPVLEQGIRARENSLNVFDIVDWYTARGERETLASLAPIIDQAIRQQTDLPTEFILGTSELLCELRDLQAVAAVHQGLVAGGLMHHHYFATQNTPNVAGAILWCILAVRPNGNADQVYANGANGQQLVNQLLDNPRNALACATGMREFCVNMGIANDWIHQARTQPRLTNLLGYFLEDGAIINGFVMVLKAGEFRASLDDLGGKIGRNLREAGLIEPRFGDSDFVRDLPAHLTGLDDAWLMTYSLTALPDDLKSAVINNAKRMLLALDEATWLSQLDRSKDVLELITALLGNDEELTFGAPLKEALRSLLRRYKTARACDDAAAIQFSTLMKALSEDGRKSVADQAYEDLASASGSYGTSWVVLEPLVSDSLIRHRGTLRIGRRLLLPTLEAQDIDGLTSLAHILGQNWARAILEEDRVALDDVRQKVESMQSQEALAPQLAEVLSKLAVIWQGDTQASQH